MAVIAEVHAVHNFTPDYEDAKVKIRKWGLGR